MRGVIISANFDPSTTRSAPGRTAVTTIAYLSQGGIAWEVFTVAILPAIYTRMIVVVVTAIKNTAQSIFATFLKVVRPGRISVFVHTWPVDATFSQNICNA